MPGLNQGLLLDGKALQAELCLRAGNQRDATAAVKGLMRCSSEYRPECSEAS